MANRRSPGQQMLAFTLDKQLADRLDQASTSQGRNRSEFIRSAVINYLESMGIDVPGNLRFAPETREAMLAEPTGAAPPYIEGPKKKIDYRTISRKTPPRKKGQ